MGRRSHFRRLAFLYAGLVLACAQAPARAGFDASVAVNVTSSGDLYTYTYTVTVAADSTVPVSEFDVAVNDPVGLTSITTPGDFGYFYNPGDPYIAFSITGIDDGIDAGQSGIFSFTSLSAPGLVSDQLQGLDSSTFTVDSDPGVILGAAIVPEPSSLMLCALGGIGVGLFGRARRSRSA